MDVVIKILVWCLAAIQTMPLGVKKRVRQQPRRVGREKRRSRLLTSEVGRFCEPPTTQIVWHAAWSCGTHAQCITLWNDVIKVPKT